MVKLFVGLLGSTAFSQCLQLLNITGPVLMNIHTHTHTLRSDLFTTSLNYSTHTHIVPDVEIKRIPAGVECELFWKI